TIVLLTIAFVNVYAEGYAQAIVSFTGKSVKLEQVFRSIKKQTGYVVMYNKAVIDNTRPVTISVKNIPLTEFLDQIFKDQPLEFTIRSRSIFISSRTPVAGSSDRQPNTPGTGVLDPSLYIDTLEKSIRGRVTNNAGEPLSGANVVIKRTGKGTITNANGEFKLNGVNTDDILVVSYIGYA